MCNFKPDDHMSRLYERLEKYYRDTAESGKNDNTMWHYQVFRTWCSDNGYTPEEVRQAKRVVKV